jgi:hypothetical protein
MRIAVIHPVKIPQLIACLGIIQDLLVSEKKKYRQSRTVQISHDIFGKLPYGQGISVSSFCFQERSGQICIENDTDFRASTDEIGRRSNTFISQALEARLSVIIVGLERECWYKEGKVDHIPGQYHEFPKAKVYQFQAFVSRKGLDKYASKMIQILE